MKYAAKFLFLSIFLLLFSYCSRLKYDVIPDADAIYRAVTVRVNVKVAANPAANTSRRRQNFKIVLKYDDHKDKMLFLSPLNQVYGRLFIEDERALLINSKKKRYWKGRFKTLIREIWALDFSYAQFKELILEGAVSQKELKEKGLKISLEREEKSDKPKRVLIEFKNVKIRLKMSGRRMGKGRIDFEPRLEKVERTTIERVLQSR
ncbi:MAG: outer membrane lipoprotein LolB [bacterium]|nr:outer membrane lipoprotein LolB [bacterium]